jgi:hypothetical protein
MALSEGLYFSSYQFTRLILMAFTAQVLGFPRFKANT